MEDRVRVLIASTPLTGHLNPLLSIGHALLDEGHEVLGLSANIMRHRIEGIGAAFRAFPAGADLDLSDRDALFPEWKKIPPGPERTRFALERVFVDAIPPQHEGLRQVRRHHWRQFPFRRFADVARTALAASCHRPMWHNAPALPP
jgi:hypothetical protein